MSLKKLFFLSTVIFLIGQIDLYAQSEKVSLSGTIQDAKSGETLPFVVVNIKDLNLWTTSDINGKFSFKDVKIGDYTLTASCLGYKDYEMKINLSKNKIYPKTGGTNPGTKRSYRDSDSREQA